MKGKQNLKMYNSLLVNFYWLFQILFREKLQEKGVRIRILGNLALLPEDVCALISEAMDITQNNDKAFLNIAMSYTCKLQIQRKFNDFILFFFYLKYTVVLNFDFFLIF